MKQPLETVKGRVVGYDERARELLIRAPYPDWETMLKRNFKTCLVQPMDSRPLSAKQRRACYAMIGEISDYTGEGRDPTKERMKLKFLASDTEAMGDKIFSLSNAPMSLVCGFQRFLVRFILDWDIPTRFPLLDMVDDVGDYLYHCLLVKKCCITGRPAQLHHIDRVGMGRDRTDIAHEGMEVLPLAPEMHQLAHTMTDREFFDRYHLPGGIVLDQTLCRVWKLKRRKDHGESHDPAGPHGGPGRA